MEEPGEVEGVIGVGLMACLPLRKNNLVKALVLKVPQLAQRPYEIEKDSVAFGEALEEDSVVE